MNYLEKDFKLDNSIGYVVNRLANKMRINLESRFEKHGHDISAVQWMVLSIIIEHNGISQNELALRSKKDKTNIARIIERLVKKELIEKLRDDVDRRAFKLFVTQKGKALRSELSEIAVLAVTEASQGITKEEHDNCLKTLKKIYSNLE